MFGSHRMTPADIEDAAQAYRRLLIALRDERLDATATAPDGTLSLAFEQKVELT
jgi:hypothetical protein